jgi:aryl-alcohol dehydrogenase-like predicted oxidoreductase
MRASFRLFLLEFSLSLHDSTPVAFCHCCLQVQYSLLYRKPEQNGVLDACREAGVTLVAYSPLCQGLLTGGHHTTCAGHAEM